MTPQDTFMVMAPIAAGKEPALSALLNQMVLEPGIADPNNPVIPFARFDRLHVARLFILDISTWRDIEAHGVRGRPYPHCLVLLGDIDGDRESFLTELAELADPGLRQLFSHCEGFGDPVDLREWLIMNNVKEAANYVNTRGRTLEQIREEDALHRALADHLADMVARDDPVQTYDALCAHIRSEQQAGRLTLTPPKATPWRWRLQKIARLLSLPIGAALLSPLIVLGLPFFLICLRRHERTDPEVLPRTPMEKIAEFSRYEDHDVTNAFTAAGDVKPGRFRRYLVTFLLWLLDYGNLFLYGRGRLARVTTIHFARWVFIDDKRRVLFCSNYDGSIESYMDDFINKVAFGLTLVFSNGVGYPRTRFLVKGGAEYEDRFKRFMRARQMATQVWYKAYPGLSTSDLTRNSRIRAGFEKRPTTKSGLRDWLRDI